MRNYRFNGCARGERLSLTVGLCRAALNITRSLLTSPLPFSFQAIKERKLTRQTLKENNKISTSDASDVGIKKRQAFLDLLLDGNENENQLLSDDDVASEVNTFMFAVRLIVTFRPPRDRNLA
jgi:hypothetical protein